MCRSCRAHARGVGYSGGPRPCGPEPRPPGMPRCWAATRLDGPIRTAITAYKDQDRRDLEPVLAQFLASALVCALVSEPGLRRAATVGARVVLVPMPTSGASRRRRGDDPVRALTGHALVLVGAGDGTGDLPSARRRSGAGLVLAPAVRHARAVADQSGLGRVARAHNLHGALALDPAWGKVVAGASCVLADDVVTTGASLVEAARVLRESGAEEVVAVTVAATASHRDEADPRRERVPLVGRWVPG